MSNPLRLMRKYQKRLMVFFGVLLMLAFIVGGSLMQFTSPGRTKVDRNPTVVKWVGGSMKRNELNYLKEQHRITQMFLQLLVQEGMLANRESAVQFVPNVNVSLMDVSLDDTDQSDRDMMMILMLARKAEQMGMSIGEASIKDYLSQACDRELSEAQMNARVMEMTNSRMRLSQVIEHLKTELLALQMRDVLASTYFPGFDPIVTPVQAFAFDARQYRTTRIQVVPYLVENYLDQVKEEPSEREIKKLYEEGWFRFEDPYGKRPGFRQPRKLHVAWIEPDVEALRPAADAIPEEEIKARYELWKNDKTSQAWVIQAKPADAGQDGSNPADPAATDPNATDPNATDPNATDPNATDPNAPATDPMNNDGAGNDGAGSGGAGSSGAGDDASATPPTTDNPPAADDGQQSSGSQNADPQSGQGTSSGDTSSGDTNSGDDQSGDGSSSQALNSNDHLRFVSVSQDTQGDDKQADDKQADDTQGGDTQADDQKQTDDTSGQPQSEQGQTEQAQTEQQSEAQDPPPTKPMDQPPADANITNPPSNAAGIKQEPTLLPLEEVRDKIINVLQGEKANERAWDIITQLTQDYLDPANEDFVMWEAQGEETEDLEAPSRPDIATFVTRNGFRYHSTMDVDTDDRNEDGLVSFPTFTRTELAKEQIIDINYFQRYQTFPTLGQLLAARFDSLVPYDRQMEPDTRERTVPIDPKNPDAGTRPGNPPSFVYWLVEKREPNTPDLEDCRDEVIRFWKLDKARELAKADAESLIQWANNQQKPFVENSEVANRVLETSSPFPWMSSGGGNLAMGSGPLQITDVAVRTAIEGSSAKSSEIVDDEGNLKGAGNDFMSDIFKIDAQKSGLTSNARKDVYFAVYVLEKGGLSPDLLKNQVIRRRTVDQYDLEISNFESLRLFDQRLRDLEAEMDLAWLPHEAP